MKAAQTRSRHGLTTPMVRVKLRGFHALDRRMAGAREAMAFQRELVGALGGGTNLSPQRRRLVDLATRAWLFLNHLDGFLVEQSTLVNKRSRAVIPALVQRQALADHLVRLMEKLGLDQAPKKVVDLTSYVAERYGAAERVRHSGSDTSAQPAPPTTSTTPAATETRAGP